MATLHPAIVGFDEPILVRLCRRCSVRRLDVFGSAVRDDFDPARSDIDVLVTFDDTARSDYARAFFELREGLSALFSRNVDLVSARSVANPYLDRSIGSGRVTLFRLP